MTSLLRLGFIGLTVGTLGCSLDTGALARQPQAGGATEDQPGATYRQCVVDVLDRCDGEDLTPAACTELIAQTCNQASPDDCFSREYEACLEACQGGFDPGGACGASDDNGADCQCEERCRQYAEDICQPPPPDDCFQRVYDDCLSTCEAGMDPNGTCPPSDPNQPGCPGGCEEECARRAAEVCEPPPPDDCFLRVYEECLGGCQGQNPDGTCGSMDPAGENCSPDCDERCKRHAEEVCQPPPEDCHERVFRECREQGGSEEACRERAAQECDMPPSEPDGSGQPR